MFRNKISQRDLYITNPTDRFLGPITQEQGPLSQNGSFSETPQSNTLSLSEENSQKFGKDWSFIGTYSQKRASFSVTKPAPIHRPISLNASKEPESNKFYDLRNEAVLRDIVEMLHLILNNQREILDAQNPRDTRNLLESLLETQKLIFEEQRQFHLHQKEQFEIVKSVKQETGELDKRMTEMLQKQAQESSRVQAAFEKQLQIKNEMRKDIRDMLQMTHLQSSLDNALTDHNQDIKMYFKKQMAVFNMDIVRAFQSQCTRSLEYTMVKLFNEHFNKIMEALNNEFLTKTGVGESNTRKPREFRDEENVQWIEGALTKLQSLHNSKSGLILDKTRDKNMEHFYKQSEPTFKVQPSLRSDISWVSSTFQEDGCNGKSTMHIRQMPCHQMLPSLGILQTPNGYRKHSPLVPSFKKPSKENQKKIETEKKLREKSYTLRSAIAKNCSPNPNRSEIAFSHQESSSGISCSTVQIFKKPGHFAQQRRRPRRQQTDSMKWT